MGKPIVRAFSFFRFQGLDFENMKSKSCLRVVYDCGHSSWDHLLIYNLSKASIEICGILSRKTPVLFNICSNRRPHVSN